MWHMIEAKIVSDNVHMIPLISKLLEYTYTTIIRDLAISHLASQQLYMMFYANQMHTTLLRTHYYIVATYMMYTKIDTSSLGVLYTTT